MSIPNRSGPGAAARRPRTPLAGRGASASQPRSASLAPGPPLLRGPAERLLFLLRVAMDAPGLVGERFDRYGDVYYVPGQRRPGLYVLRHPEHIRRVLVADAASYSRRHGGFAVLSQVLGDGLLTSEGALWRRHRRMLQPAFQRRMLESYAPLVVEETERQLDGWHDGAILDVCGAMAALTLRIVARALFHHDASRNVATIARATAALQRATLGAGVLPSWMPLPGRRRLERAVAEVDRVVYGMIRQRRESPQAESRDVLQALLEAVDEEQGRPLDDREIRDELLTLVMAGHETTSHALSWTLFLLSQNPHVEARLYDELAAIPRARSVTPEDLSQLPLVERVLKESMRLYPPAYTLTRRAERDTAIDDFLVRRGSEVMIWTYWTHRDRRWFPEPERFVPERFAPEGERQLPRLAYLPFGAGPRVCIGGGFAMLNARLILATIGRRFRLRLLPGHRVRPRTRITLYPANGLPMRLYSRAQPARPRRSARASAT